MNLTEIINKVWNYAHVLCDDGVGYGDYVGALMRIHALAIFEHPYSRTTTYLIFLKMADERESAGHQSNSFLST